jgi:hypothetical protein
MTAGLLALCAGGCATWGPTWSEVTGERYHRAIMDRRPAIIEKIDGNSAFPSSPIKVEPGRHEIVMQGPKLDWPGGTQLHTMTLDLQPCMRYYLNAQFDNPVAPTWSPVVDYVEAIAGCKIAATAAK